MPAPVDDFRAAWMGISNLTGGEEPAADHPLRPFVESGCALC